MEEEVGQATEQPVAPDDILGRLNNFLQQDDAPSEEPAPQETAEEPQAEEPEDEGVVIDPDVPLMEITVKTEDGEETRAWSLNEMKAGVMMQRDYQRKTAELARAREQMQQEVQKLVEPERQQFTQHLQFLQQAVQALVLPDFQNVDMEKLAVENPSEYVRLNAKAQRVQQTLAALQGQMQQVQQQQMAQIAEQSRQILQDPVRGIPGWGQEKYSTIINEGSKVFGFSPEEVANVVDYRMIKVLHDALEYQKVKSAKPEISKKVAVAPKVIKPGATSSSDAQAQKVTDLEKRFKKSGDVKDAAALYLERMNRRR